MNPLVDHGHWRIHWQLYKTLGKNQAVAGRLADLSGDVRKAALEATGATVGRDVLVTSSDLGSHENRGKRHQNHEKMCGTHLEKWHKLNRKK